MKYFMFVEAGIVTTTGYVSDGDMPAGSVQISETQYSEDIFRGTVNQLPVEVDGVITQDADITPYQGD